MYPHGALDFEHTVSLRVQVPKHWVSAQTILAMANTENNDTPSLCALDP